MAPKKIFVNVISILVLWAMVAMVVSLVFPGDDWKIESLVGGAISIPISVATWNRFDEYTIGDWIGMFALSIALTCVFLFIDCDGGASYHGELASCRGFNSMAVIFTVVAACLALASFVGALRIVMFRLLR